MAGQAAVAAVQAQAHAPWADGISRTRLESDVLLILQDVARKHHLDISHITGKSHASDIVNARSEAAKRLYFDLHLTLKAVGRLLGKRHHTTILYLIRRQKVEYPPQQCASPQSCLECPLTECRYVSHPSHLVYAPCQHCHGTGKVRV